MVKKKKSTFYENKGMELREKHKKKKHPRIKLCNYENFNILQE